LGIPDRPIFVWTNSVPKGRLISRITKTKWKLVKVWDVLPFAYGNKSGSFKCGCRWEPVGCTENSHYKVLKPHKATFDCDDGECRVWKETQYKDIEINVYVEAGLIRLIKCIKDRVYNQEKGST
jgi:hypothetical protein